MQLHRIMCGHGRRRAQITVLEIFLWCQNGGPTKIIDQPNIVDIQFEYNPVVVHGPVGHLWMSGVESVKQGRVVFGAVPGHNLQYARQRQSGTDWTFWIPAIYGACVMMVRSRGVVGFGDDTTSLTYWIHIVRIVGRW